MATGVKAWSTTAADNDDADSNINWLEGQAPSTVNDSARAMMAAIAAWRDLIGYGTVSAGTVGGTGNAITLTCSPTVEARTAGRRYLFKAGAANTGGVTLTVDSTTAAGALQYLNTALVSGDIAQDDWLLVEDDGTNFQLLTPPRMSYLKLIIAGLTEDATPDGTADYYVALDSSASLAKKVKVSATQAQMEAMTSTGQPVTPARQHFHPGHPKFWAYVTVSGGTPSLVTSYNVTGIVDTGTGDLLVTIATDFSGATWAPFVSIEVAGAVGGATAARDARVKNSGIAAGTVACVCTDFGASPNAADPSSWSVLGLGDQ